MSFEFKIERLAAELCNLPEDCSTEDVDDALYEQLDCSFECFQEIVQRLLPMIDAGESPLSGKLYKGFAKDECFLVKIPV